MWKSIDRRILSDPSVSKGLIQQASIAELNNTLASLDMGKAKDNDGMSAELFKALPDSARSMLAKNLSDIIKTGYVPARWKRSMIYTIHNSGDPSKWSNYRPISISCIAYKIFMIIITKRVNSILEKHHYFPICKEDFVKEGPALRKH